jgi:hypothetical protein
MTKDNPHRIVADAAGAVDQKDDHQTTAPSALFQRGLEAAMERDRRFFARHPFLSEYTREIMPGEFPPSEMPRGFEAHGRVIVRQIAPGFRIRHFAPGCFFFVMGQRR